VNERRDEGQGLRLGQRVLLVLAAMVVFMSAYEALKQVIAPGITIIQSHVVTVIFSSLAAAAAAWAVLLRREALLARLRRENTLRRAAEDTFRRLAMRRQDLLEQERRHIARELHDELGQDLTALDMGLERLRRVCPEPSALAKVDDLRAIADRTLGVVERVVGRLRPALLDELGLDAALRRLASDFQRQSGLEVRLELDDDLAPDPEQALALYRVLQESLTNAARHAHCPWVAVRLWRESGGALLEVRDEGQGMDPVLCQAADGFGLLGMRERVESLGGRFAVDSGPGRGVAIRAWLPLARTSRARER